MNAILPLLAIESRVGPEGLRAASRELAAVGVEVSAEDLTIALRAARAYRNGLTEEWEVPSAVQPSFGYDGLQDAIMDRTNLRGAAFGRAWTAVKGHLRLRWAKGNYSRPMDATVVRWALAA